MIRRGARRLALALALGAALQAAAGSAGPAPGGAAAPAWALIPERSEIAFDYVLEGRAATGRFTRFAGEGLLDPARPGEAALTLAISAGSIDLGNRLFSAFATSAEWFDARNHPEVRYELGALVPLGGGRYRATGEIAIRGVSRVVVSEIALALEDGLARSEGTLALDRTDFGLGVGPSALLVTVDRTVRVRFRLIAALGGPQPELSR